MRYQNKKDTPLFPPCYTCPRASKYEVHHGVKNVRKMSRVYHVVHNIHVTFLPFGQVIGIALSDAWPL